MPYKRVKDLPKQVKDTLPKEAEEIYKEAFNNAQKFYKDSSKKRDPKESTETVAAKVAWNSVKQKFKKVKDKWVKKTQS